MARLGFAIDGRRRGDRRWWRDCWWSAGDGSAALPPQQRGSAHGFGGLSLYTLVPGPIQQYWTILGRKFGRDYLVGLLFGPLLHVDRPVGSDMDGSSVVLSHVISKVS